MCPLHKCSDPQCSKKAACSANHRKLQSRNIRERRLVIQQNKKDNQQNFRGRYIGFNASSNTYSIEKIDGGILEVSGITNGQIIQGQMVSAIIPKYGSRGVILGMPTS